MKIRLRGEKRDEQRAATTGDKPDANGAGGLSRSASKRQFLKLLATGAGLAGVVGMGQVAAPARRAEAMYTVNDDMTVTGNLGVGTPSPVHRLQVETGAYSLATFRRTGLAGGMDGGWGFDVDGGNATLYLQSRAAWPNNGNLAITPSGNLGIGTINPSQGRLQIETGSYNVATFRRVGIGGADGGWGLDVDGGDGGLYLQSRDAGPNRDGGLAVKPSGNVGIGTYWPVEKLNVVGNIRVDGGGALMIGSNVAIDAGGVAQQAKQSYYAS